MKKILLPVFALCSYMGFAQCGEQGYNATGAYDDMSAPSEFGNGPNGEGVYFWGEDDVAAGANPGFGAVLNRDNLDSELEVTLTQPYGSYVPFGFSFGDSNGDGTGDKYVIDMSGDAQFSMEITNNDPDSTIRVRLAPQDVNNNTIDTYAAAGSDDPTNAWQYSIQVDIAPGQTATLSGDFAGGYFTNYATFPPTLDQTVDFTKISGFLITIINVTQNAADGFNPYALDAVPVSIKNVAVGSCSAVGLGEEYADVDAFSIYPNPAADEVSFSEELSNVRVFNAQGTMVQSAASATDLNVSSLENGIYMIQADQGRTQLVVE